jgi:para-aminobenzoate synthetase component 1
VKKAVSFPIKNLDDFKIKMLNWANRFNIFCLLDNHQYQFEKPSFECLLAVGCRAKLSAGAGSGAFDQLKIFSRQHIGWLFGHFSYDLKNELENLQSNHPDGVGFEDLSFFVPEIVLEISNDKVLIYSDIDEAGVFEEVMAASSIIPTFKVSSAINIQHKLDKQTYIKSIEQLQLHILQGDCYELNFCQEFFAQNAVIDPLNVYLKLSAISPSPFAVLYKLNDTYCIGASPERYLKKNGSIILSQPIKGTAIRDLKNLQQDEQSKHQLINSEKEKSENVMVVDLVRNDLSKICKEGTVKVDELFGLYSFPQVHQMISSISGELQNGLDWVDAIKATFPMGSMTGAPKKKVMQLIEQYEQTKRGLYSGAIGYVHPNGNFDFNVVIRSILYNAVDQYVSFQTGSAITFHSNPQQEYEECLLKAKAIRQVLEV